MIKTENAVNGEPSFSFNSWGDFLVGNVASFTRPCRTLSPTCTSSTPKHTSRMIGSLQNVSR